MVVMATVTLLVLGISVGVGLRKAIIRPPYARERPPLIPMPLQPRNPHAIYPSNNAYLFDMVPDAASSPNSVTLKGFSIRKEEVINTKVVDGTDGPSEGQIEVVTVSSGHMYSHDITQNHLTRSVSQMIEKKMEEGKEVAWDPHFRALHDSGMFDEEFVDTIKGFSTVRKEHTMFTDTNL